MTRHDPLFKDLFRSCFRDLLRLADPDPRGVLAKRLESAEIRFLDKEVFQDAPEGRRLEVDLLAEVPRRNRRPAFLIHVEIERRYLGDFGRRLARYSYLLSLRHAIPVISIVVFLRGGPPGARWIERIERACGLEVHRLRYLCLGLSGAPAESLLVRPEPLAWALACLARAGTIGRARFKLEILKKIATASISVEERFLLTNCVETYLQLTGRDAEEYADLRHAPGYREVEAMQLTWAERMEAQYMKRGLAKGLEKGLEQGLEEGLEKGLAQGLVQGRKEGEERLRQTILRLLEQRFGTVSPKVRKRLAAIDSVDELGEIADRILEVESIGDLGLDP